MHVLLWKDSSTSVARAKYWKVSTTTFYRTCRNARSEPNARTPAPCSGNRLAFLAADANNFEAWLALTAVTTCPPGQVQPDAILLRVRVASLISRGVEGRPPDDGTLRKLVRTRHFLNTSSASFDPAATTNRVENASALPGVRHVERADMDIMPSLIYMTELFQQIPNRHHP